MTKPACGLYRTTAPIGEVPAGRLVLFHNHGDPGPGVYLPASWTNNRAEFHRRGVTLPDAELASTLHPLPAEGLYVVETEFVCCEKACRTYAPDSLVQLGYDGRGRAILFIPSLSDAGMSFPDRGTAIDDDRLPRLKQLKVAGQRADLH